MAELFNKVFKNKPNLKIFNIQFGDILALELGLLIGSIYTKFPFLILQIVSIPVILYLLFSKFTKSVTELNIDTTKRSFKFELNYFVVFNKKKEVAFDDIYIFFRNKWLYISYIPVIEFRLNNTIIAIIPFKKSIWNDKEWQEIKFYLQQLVDLGILKKNQLIIKK